MIITGIRLPVGHSEKNLYDKIKNKVEFKEFKYKIIKKSLDARKSNLSYVYSVEVCKLNDVFDTERRLEVKKVKSNNRPIIIGFGPSGIFCAYILAKAGLNPIVLEMGEDVDTRKSKVNTFWNGGLFDRKTNVQFGEGGAGTFSDGKLTTQISNPLCKEVLRIFTDFGAPDEINYLKKPHIGTDLLINVIKNIREEIKLLGGSVIFNEEVTEFEISNGKIKSVAGGKKYVSDDVVLAIGHSSRNTFDTLYKLGVNMIPKAFSVGVRIEHLQNDIDISQYGDLHRNLGVGPAEYKLWTHLNNGRGVYTFCMCPGGNVVSAVSEKGGIVTNGMSYHSRNGINANSAVLVSVTPDDFKSDTALSGVQFQRKLEQAAFAVSQSYKAPCQTFSNFKNKTKGEQFGKILPSYMPGTVNTNMSEIFPNYIFESLVSGITEFGNKMKGFDCDDAVLTGPETRSSSPVRIIRGDNMMSNIEGLYPIGEGAGYAGGITSSAVDGIKCALLIIEKYSNKSV